MANWDVTVGTVGLGAYTARLIEASTSCAVGRLQADDPVWSNGRARIMSAVPTDASITPPGEIDFKYTRKVIQCQQ